MEDALALDDWPCGDSELTGGVNHWLPAYGYQQPALLHQALLQQGRDADLPGCDAVAVQQQFVFLETILEETSDDLQSESDRSGTVGWPDSSDSDTESVIHVTNDIDGGGRWSGSERDIAVPKKRRRRSADDLCDEAAAEEGGSLTSRSSSLIQFECLERHCETASLEPPAAGSSDEEGDSDDTLRLSSWSSRASSFRSSGRLHSFRSLDGLNLLSPPPAAAPEPPPRRSAENLSEDSGFGDQEGRRAEDDSDCSSGGAKERTPSPGEDAKFSVAAAGGGGEQWRSEPRLDEPEPPRQQHEATCSAPDLLRAADMAGREVRFSPTVDHVSWRDGREGEASPLLVRRVQVGGPGAASPRADMDPRGSRESSVDSVASIASSSSGKKGLGRFGGFFQRFSLRRLGGGRKARGDKKRASSPPPPPPPARQDAEYEDVRIIPLHRGEGAREEVVASKPPLPPRRQPSVAAEMSGARPGLLETDLDAAGAAPPQGKKARSLADLGAGAQPLTLALPPPGGRDSVAADSRARSMEFLLDKENQAAVKPPENELQKGERVMSEHQLRVQRSLQKLNVPDWYKNSSAARTPEGWLRGQQQRPPRDGWPGLGSKTTSLSSLGSTQSAAPRSPTGQLLSPSPTPHVFTRWSTSRLNSSAATSTSTSPCGSTRSSFSHRQPYLGWRSQERLARPRTPAERLAAGLLPAPSPSSAAASPDGEPSEEDRRHAQQVPNLSEVRTSIKEVTSAIVHYVSSAKGGSGEALSPGDRPSPSPRSGSPRGSGRLCWLESSFVGTRPLDSPETPSAPAGADALAALDGGGGRLDASGAGSELYLDLGKARPLGRQLNGEYLLTCPLATDQAHLSAGNYVRKHLQLESYWNHDFQAPRARGSRRARTGPARAPPRWTTCWTPCWACPPPRAPPAPCPAARPRRPPAAPAATCAPTSQVGGPWSASEAEQAPPPYYVADTLRRRSEGSDPGPRPRPAAAAGRRVSFDVAADGEPLVRCRYSKCARAAPASEARRSYKTCHNCSHAYCSRECRRAHWERHRRTCLHSRVGALCRQVLAAVKEEPACLRHVSLLARRGYLAQGRGAVKSFFSSPEAAERFVAHGLRDLGEPTFVRWADLLPDEMGPDLYAELVRQCKAYNPDTRLVVYVAVCVVSEAPTSGAVRWERQLVSRCAKLRLSRPDPPPPPPSITRDMDDPETLILTSLPGCHGRMSPRRAREISFANIQRQLRQRGVSLRRHFPDVYRRLCAYVDGAAERFAPVTLYPRDASGKGFMCIIMPDAEPGRLELVPRDSSRVRTVDIGPQLADDGPA
ncbi:uncharacterized protein LOC134538369 [Bacillus rossius redtenbacheri]|uniref:uncharacterized protein LOC134538369 n=1 Tax=Bacillus rossius redtenbacheri TaxID=93214 RepID=UPI002FDD1C2D